MPFNGSGTFVRVHNWTADAANGLDINASEMDAEDNGFAAGLSNCVTRDGQGQMNEDFLPSVGGTFNLGSAAKPWASINGLPIASIASGIYYAQTAAEGAAGVTPTTYTYAPGDVRRYGAVLDGVTDDTTALTNWAKVGSALVFPVAQTALISVPIALVSNSTLTFAAGATITSTNSCSLLTMTSLTNTIVRGATFMQSGVQTGSPNGLTITSCTYCTIEGCTFNGMLYNGILAKAISYCTIRANIFINASGTAQLQDSGDIQVISSNTVTSSYNVIDGNFCYGGGEFGIAVWDPYSGVLPAHNIVCNNRIGGASGYGILIYMPDRGDSYTQVLGNHVEGILGNIASNNSSGAGIYLTGNGIGGTVVANNTIRNCCIDTANATLAPAGIAVTGGSAPSLMPITIIGNTISDMPQYGGIALSSVAGAAVTGNVIRMPATQVTVGSAIQIVNSYGVTVTGNSIALLTTTQNMAGIAIEAIGAPYSNVTVANNTIQGGHYAQIRIVNDASLYGHLAITGNICFGADTNCIPLNIESGSAVDVMVVGNSFTSQSATAVQQTACQNVRYSANFLSGTGAILNTYGTCTGSFFDRSNVGTGTGAGVDNAAGGFIIEQLGTALPTAGTWGVGDTVRNSAPSAAGVYEWICTTAGSPGTWKSISNT